MLISASSRSSPCLPLCVCVCTRIVWCVRRSIVDCSHDTRGNSVTHWFTVSPTLHVYLSNAVCYGVCAHRYIEKGAFFSSSTALYGSLILSSAYETGALTVLQLLVEESSVFVNWVRFHLQHSRCGLLPHSHSFLSLSLSLSHTHTHTHTNTHTHTLSPTCMQSCCRATFMPSC